MLQPFKVNCQSMHKEKYLFSRLYGIQCRTSFWPHLGRINSFLNTLIKDVL